MSDELKPMPPAAVIYLTTFDESGAPTVQAKIHTDVAGRVLFEGDPAKAYALLSSGLEATAKRFAASATEQLMRAVEEKRLLNAELHNPGGALTPAATEL